MTIPGLFKFTVLLFDLQSLHKIGVRNVKCFVKRKKFLGYSQWDISDFLGMNLELIKDL